MTVVGRAVVWWPYDYPDYLAEGAPPLPPDIAPVAIVHDPFRDLSLLIVEGPGLPAWQRGGRPYEFDSLDALLAHLEKYASA